MQDLCAMQRGTVAFGALAALLLVGMIVTSVRSPLFPFRTESMKWLQDWLTFSVRTRPAKLFCIRARSSAFMRESCPCSVQCDA